jgi:hypothetical protein
MKKNDRECQMLRQQISEYREMFKPIQAISYKVHEIPKLYDVYSNDLENLREAKDRFEQLAINLNSLMRNLTLEAQGIGAMSYEFDEEVEDGKK